MITQGPIRVYGVEACMVLVGGKHELGNLNWNSLKMLT